MNEFTMSRTLPLAFDASLAAFKAALTAQGFGVLYELDFSAIIAEKTGNPLPGRVVGLGVCDPRLARQALLAEPLVAALLPCGVFAIESQAGTTLGALDPGAAMALTGLGALESLGQETKARLQAALDGVSAA